MKTAQHKHIAMLSSFFFFPFLFLRFLRLDINAEVGTNEFYNNHGMLLISDQFG